MASTAISTATSTPAPEPHHRRVRLAHRFSQAAGWAGIAACLLVWSGWWLQIQALIRVFPDAARMTPNTALCFLLAGLTLLGGDRVARAAGWAMAALAGLTLSQYAGGWDLGLDRMLFAGALESVPREHAGRMAAFTALGFLLLGAGAAAGAATDGAAGAGRSRTGLRQTLAMLAFVISFTAMMAYSHGFEVQQQLAGFSTMAVHTSLLFIVLSLGTLARTAEDGWMGTVLGEGPGGVLVRRSWPAAMLLALLSYWAQALGGRAGWYSPELGLVLYASLSLGGFSGLIWLSGRWLERADIARQNEHGQRERAEARLRVQSAIVDSSQDAILSMTAEGVIQSWNGGAERLLGYRGEEIVGRPVERLIPEDFRARERDWRARAARGEAVALQETVRCHKDGRRMEVSLRISPIYDAQQRPAGLSSIARDITESKAAERRLREALREVSHLKEALDEHSIVAITDPRGAITYVNDKFCSISKYAREELMGQNHRIINSGHHPPEFFTDMWSAIASGRVWKGEIKNRAKDGTYYWVDTTIVPFTNLKGTPREYVAIRTDITPRKLAAEALERRSRELERSNAALESFAYVASHDLQEPLRGVSGCVQLLQNRYYGRLDEAADEFIRHAVDNLDRMQQLILGLLEYSRLDRVSRPFAVVDCNQALCQARANLEVAIREAHAEVTGERLPAIEGDAAQLMQLFQNLLGNAIKFRGEAPPRVSVSARPAAGGQWEFLVADNGIGMEARHQQRIFGLFQRLHPRTRYPGTGMGLAICHRIVERHGGRIWVESEPGRGAVFHFTLRDRMRKEHAA